MIKLYNIDGCGYCGMVRKVLEELKIEYDKIDVPWSQFQRKEVYQVSGQYTVPVLVDGEKILDDEYEVIHYLKQAYPVNT